MTVLTALLNLTFSPVTVSRRYRNTGKVIHGFPLLPDWLLGALPTPQDGPRHQKSCHEVLL
jgi:hypothetical protein